MDRDNLGYALVKFGMSIVYLCTDLIIEVTKILVVIMKNRRAKNRYRIGRV